MMRVVIAGDHAGFELKRKLLPFLEKIADSEIQDLGTFTQEPVDYPDYAEKAALALRKQEADRAILICGSGVGACVAANKIPGIRASVCHDIYSAHQGVEHDDMNVLVLGAGVVALNLAQDLASAFLMARFSGETRHLRRLKKIEALEIRNWQSEKGQAILERKILS